MPEPTAAHAALARLWVEADHPAVDRVRLHALTEALEGVEKTDG